MSINVLVIDDSALIRKIMSDMIASTDDINLVDTAYDAIIAIEKIKENNIDVIILDIAMPRMDGLTFLEKLMKAKPTPVIVLSALSRNTPEISIKSFQLGAFEVFSKPENVIDLPEMESELLKSIRSAAESSVKIKLQKQFQNYQEKSKETLFEDSKIIRKQESKNKEGIILIGSSTGGTNAVMEIISDLPYSTPGIVVVQHLPKNFSNSFVEWLNTGTRLEVKMARQGEQVLNGHIYLAPGGMHCSIMKKAQKYYINLIDCPNINYHKPSVSTLFGSMTSQCDSQVIAVMLSGMGEDGAAEMKLLHDQGAFTIAQNEESSVVWGMPGKAVEYKAVKAILPPGEIAQEILKYLEKV